MTAKELVNSAAFQGLFNFEYDEAFHRLVPTDDARIVGKVAVTVLDKWETLWEGRFEATVETTEGVIAGEPWQRGMTLGTFRLRLPVGLNGDSAEEILDDAKLEVHISSQAPPSAFPAA